MPFPHQLSKKSQKIFNSTSSKCYQNCADVLFQEESKSGLSTHPNMTINCLFWAYALSFTGRPLTILKWKLSKHFALLNLDRAEP